ncbi:integrase arm-type DNA-binding domain-containing protein [Ottowia beijingensis]|uniref:integrase arm-type DNA-binding domain-containing protein n=1 Tax=Ottowia beijingensis TaxID=1207057 RepID=UPI0036409E1A
MALSDRTIQGAKPKTLTGSDGGTRLVDNWLSDGGARGAGRLCVRIQPNGKKLFYFRASGAAGRQSLPLGEYQQSGARGLTLAAARDEANKLTALLRAGVTDLRAHLEAEQRAIERERMAADEAERQARTEATRGTLRALLAGYTSGLERAEKVDWKDAESILRLHVLEPFPELADRKAAEIKPAELRPVLARLVDAKKGRTAGKARSYLHAAYAAAIRADFDPDAPQSLCGFRIESNPVAAMPSMAHYNKAGQRVLSEAELQAYMARLSGLSTMTRLALELDLMLGGQRPTQLLRVTSADVDVTADPGEIVLLDGKGARKQARVHVLPLVGRAREIAHSTDGGQ